MTGTGGDLFDIELLRRRIGRTAFVAVVAGLSVGLAAYFGRQAALSTSILAWTVGILFALPIVNVLAVLAEEVRRRDWAFVWLAIAVLGLLAFAVVTRVLVTLASKGL
jgi:hypothetical protein